MTNHSSAPGKGASMAPSARPAWALTMWADDSFIYTEIPAKSGPPLIQKYELCEGGLSKALAFMRDFHRKHQPKGGDYKITLQAKITRPAPQATDASREKAREILRKLKIT